MMQQMEIQNEATGPVRLPRTIRLHPLPSPEGRQLPLHELRGGGLVMVFDKKDRALIAASSLVGYCMSVGDLLKFTTSTDDFEAIKRWGLGLLESAKYAGMAIDAAMDDTTRPGVGITGEDE